MPTDDARAAASRRDLLKRIADALDMPTSALYEPKDADTDRPAAKLRDDARAMFAAFVKIRDPEKRRACLDYVSEVLNAEQSGAEGGGPDRDVF